MTNCNVLGIAGKLGQPASTGRGQPSVLAWQQKTSAFCFLQTSPLCQCAMEGGSIETRVIIDPPNGNTNTDGKAKVNCPPHLVHDGFQNNHNLPDSENFSTTNLSNIRLVNTWPQVTMGLFMG